VPGPLHGFSVLDFGRFQLGPLAGTWLADLGADVIKLESRQGDPIRGVHPASAAIVTAHNRGKRSIAVDLQTPEGREVALRLASRVDVLTHNFRNGVMERLGLGYEDVRAINKGIVYCGASAFGPKGPRACDPGNDTIGQAMGGLAFATGVAGGGPIPAGSSLSDSVGAYAMVAGVLAALLERQRSGEGQLIDISLYGTQIAMQSWETGFCSITGQIPVRNGGYPYLSGYGIYPSSDGFFAIGGLNDTQWPIMCRIIGREDLITRWPSAQARLKELPEVTAILHEVTRTQPTAYWLETLAKADLVVSPVQSYADVLQDEQARVNGYVIELEHSLPGTYLGAGSPWTFFRTGCTPGVRAPELGAHTEEILLESGYSWSEISALRESEVIGIEH
jgi:crotonobetainyl-CoA:carnitine CoA-transferase CaiB-like acyl-CoA transferase